jgi:ABC-type nitrate/sulfonate/bicarbonate transport system substrate-binding protein
MDQITIGMVAPAFLFFPIWVAQDQGFFAAEGIEARLVIYGATDKVTTALREGETQIGMVTPEGVIGDAAVGGSLRLIAGNANRAPLSLIVQKGIERIADLRGKRVGTSSLKEGTAVLVQTILAAHGLRYPGDYEFAIVGAHPQRWEHLQKGTIDAGLQLLPLNYVAEDAGFRNLAETSDYVPRYAFAAIGVNQHWAAVNRGLVVQMLKALHAATAWADAQRDAAAAILARAAKASPAYALRGLNEMLGHGVTPRDLRIDPEALEAVFAAMRATELIPPSTALSYTAVVDDSYLDAAV